MPTTCCTTSSPVCRSPPPEKTFSKSLNHKLDYNLEWCETRKPAVEGGIRINCNAYFKQPNARASCRTAEKEFKPDVKKCQKSGHRRFLKHIIATYQKA
ncbi:unnamed protein product [Mesocestoides corti]|uniref:BPTI/Kunitz inhibitor domain-containing protein n=1 Tax=Mesocestoides corti TaxID=53468 RepID=A0A0R3ULD0_MESCO|nr:unnamed protein product [Mesocestoides corti]